MYRDLPACPTPMYSLAIEPKSRGDEQKISEALHQLAEEDPTFVATRDAQTHETVISGIGDLHLRIMLEKMKDRFNLEVDTKPPKIPYQRDHHRQGRRPPPPQEADRRGGAVRRGLPARRAAGARRTGFEFVNDLFGESIPRQFLPGHREGRPRRDGQRRRSPATRCRTSGSSVYDGKHHPVDSKEVAFRTAGKFAFIDAIEKAKPVLLEPIVDMEITVPAELHGRHRRRPVRPARPHPGPGHAARATCASSRPRPRWPK